MEHHRNTLLNLVMAVVSIELMLGCRGRCEDAGDYHRPQKCSMVVTDISPGRPFKLKGVNIYNGEKEKYSEQGGWYVQYGKHIAIGDTVIKRENELLIRIHKRDSILVFSLDCKEKIDH